MSSFRRGTTTAVFRTVLLIIALTALLLTGWTFSRWIASYTNVGGFDMELTSIHQEPDSRCFEVQVSLINSGEIPVWVDNLAMRLRWEDRLIAAKNWEPDDAVISPGDVMSVRFTFCSELAKDRFPWGIGSAAPEGWSLNAYVDLRHEMRRGSFRTRREVGLGSSE